MENKVDKFIDFLIENEAFDAYVENFESYQDDDSEIDSFFEHEDDEPDYVSCSFEFDGTPEGFDFWSNLNKKWEDICS